MFKICVTIVLLAASPAYAILDFIGDTAKDAAEGAAVVGAVTELLDEVSPDNSLGEANAEIQAKNANLQSEVSSAKYIDNETKQILKGPNLTDKRLVNNIKFTTRFIQRTKSLLLKVGLLSPETTTAVNTAETNAALNESLKNQQTLILLKQQEMDRQTAKELAERKSWNDFIQHQRALRTSNKNQSQR